uniref:Uncharacterized protein n=1 Tax=Eutreptiella gymnastica TaxID=73025 RepID=A0A7S4C774_9EUGL
MGKKGISLDHVHRGEAHEGDTDWTIVRPGLNYVGFCKNQSCPVKNHSVVCNRGHGSHLVNDDVTNDVPKCPKCSTAFALSEICLYQCRAKVVVHGHDSTTDRYEAKGSETIMLGSGGQPKGAKEVRRSGECLVEITTKAVGLDACVVC